MSVLVGVKPIKKTENVEKPAQQKPKRQRKK